MREMLKLLLRHPVKLWMILLSLCTVYVYARILVVQYAVGTLLYWIHRYPRNFPHAFFLPLFYTSVTVIFFSAIYHDLLVLHSGSWRYVLPMPLAIRGRLYRIAGVPIYAFVISIAEAILIFRNPTMESDLSRLATYLQLLQQEHQFVNLDGIKLQSLVNDIKWQAWSLQTRDPTTFSYIRLPLEVGGAMLVCFIYGVALFFSEPRHDGEELRDATRNNDLGRVRAVLARGVDPNLRGSDGCTALHICAQQAMVPTAKYLLENKANPNIADHLGFTPLHWAVQMRREEVSPTNRLNMIRLLISKGADPQQGDSNGRTPRMIAEKSENRSALEILCQVTDNQGLTHNEESRGTEASNVDGISISNSPVLSSEHQS